MFFSTCILSSFGRIENIPGKKVVMSRCLKINYVIYKKFLHIVVNHISSTFLSNVLRYREIIINRGVLIFMDLVVHLNHEN